MSLPFAISSDEALGMIVKMVPKEHDIRLWEKWVAYVSASTVPGQRRKLVIDCDPGIDDTEAIMMCLAHPDVDVVGLCSVSGNVDVEKTTSNLQRIAVATGNGSIPVYKGAAAPLVQFRRDASHYHGPSGLGDCDLEALVPTSLLAPLQPEPAAVALGQLSRKHVLRFDTEQPHGIRVQQKEWSEAAVVLQQRIRDATSKGDLAMAQVLARSLATAQERAAACASLLTELNAYDAVPMLELLAIGPLTNLALAVRLDPLFPYTLKTLVIMGGTLDARGNVPGQPVAEFNFHADPESAAVVFKEYPHSTVVPWECCLRHGLKWTQLDEWLAAKTRSCEFLRAVREQSRRHIVDDSAGYLPVDPLAAAVLLDPKNIVANDGISLRHVSVELAGSLTRGQLVVDWSRLTTHIPNALLVTNVHLTRYSELMAAALKKVS
eukprot:m.95575 g.95575  ORF g.95575 m.95575 type:complete len:435 (+) comp15457_c0_seq1:40-1344(+)